MCIKYYLGRRATGKHIILFMSWHCSKKASPQADHCHCPRLKFGVTTCSTFAGGTGSVVFLYNTVWAGDFERRTVKGEVTAVIQPLNRQFVSIPLLCAPRNRTFLPRLWWNDTSLNWVWAPHIFHRRGGLMVHAVPSTPLQGSAVSIW